jgi:hypothetical protein
MEEAYPLSLALFDFVPNIAFLLGAFYLVKLTILLRGTRCARMAMAGTLLIFLGGFTKATWKLLAALQAPNLSWLGQVQFILVGIGFLAVVTAVILMARRRPQDSAGLPLAALAPWKLPFLMVMVVCSLGAYGILAYMAFNRQARLAAGAFIIAFLCTLLMGGLASASQTIALQWVEELINTAGLTGFAVGSALLYRNVLASGGAC